jgi:hypothetical protein
MHTQKEFTFIKNGDIMRIILLAILLLTGAQLFAQDIAERPFSPMVFKDTDGKYYYYNPSHNDTVFTVVIDSNASISGSINLGDRHIVGIQMPGSGWITANLTLQVSYDGVTYQNYYVDSTEYVITVANGRNVHCKTADVEGAVYIKIRSGTGSTPVNQTGNIAGRTLKIRAGNY